MQHSAANDTRSPVRMLFVCVENANRSQMAAAFATLHSGGRVQAFSAGSQPADQVNPKAVAAMREVGCNLSNARPRSTADLPDVEFDFIATMGCGDACPTVAAKLREDWNIPDPKNLPPDEFNKVRDLIEQHVLRAMEVTGVQPRINFNRAAAAAETRMKQRLTFTGGGWVLVVTGILCLVLITWAVAPALMRHANRLPGDGKNIESYGFDLSNLQVPREFVVPAMLHREMAPALINAKSSGPDDSLENRWQTMQKTNDPKYGKYLVPSDLIIGVIVNGEARAYPIQNLYVHEIVNDVLGGVPIAVTHHWPCDSVAAFDRRVNGKTLTFRVSGLVYNSNLLMFDEGGESLWSQLLAKAVSGPLAGGELTRINAQVQRWDDWSALHPNTTVLNRELHLTQRYKKAAPTQYLQDDHLLFPVPPLPADSEWPKKTPVIAVQVGEETRVFPLPWLAANAKANTSQPLTWNETIGSTSLRFVFDKSLQTARVEPESESTITFTHCYWFAWHAMHSDAVLAHD